MTQFTLDDDDVDLDGASAIGAIMVPSLDLELKFNINKYNGIIF